MKSKKLIYILLGALLLRIALAFIAWHPDVNNHVDWGIRFFQYGAVDFYAPEANVWSFTWPNQPPGTIYIFVFIKKLFDWIFSFTWFINVNIPAFPSTIVTFFENNLHQALTKLPAILADIGIAGIIYKFFKDKKMKKTGLFGAIIFLFNPVIWYNSSLWGQTDAIVNFFGLLAFYFLLKKKLTWAALSFATSIYIKASLLIFVPIFLVVALRQKYDWGKYAKAILIPLFVFGVLTLPFSRGEPLSWLYTLYTETVLTQQLHVITANAFNLWAAVAGIHELPNSLLLGPLTYESWGIILYSLAYIPAIYLVYKKQDGKSVFWALSIVAFSTFMLLTNMHERYLYPLFPVFAILVSFERRLFSLYILISGINLLNLYNLWFTPRIEVIVGLMSNWDRLVPRILGFVNTLIFARYYYLFFVANNLATYKQKR